MLSLINFYLSHLRKSLSLALLRNNEYRDGRNALLWSSWNCKNYSICKIALASKSLCTCRWQLEVKLIQTWSWDSLILRNLTFRYVLSLIFKVSTAIYFPTRKSFKRRKIHFSVFCHSFHKIIFSLLLSSALAHLSRPNESQI